MHPLSFLLSNINICGWPFIRIFRIVRNRNFFENILNLVFSKNSTLSFLAYLTPWYGNAFQTLTQHLVYCLLQFFDTTILDMCHMSCFSKYLLGFTYGEFQKLFGLRLFIVDLSKILKTCSCFAATFNLIKKLILFWPHSR